MVLPLVRNKLRLFRDLPPSLQLSLAYQFEAVNYIKGAVIVKNDEGAPGVVYIRKGTMVAIAPLAVDGGVVKLNPGDYFGELSMLFR